MGVSASLRMYNIACIFLFFLNTFSFAVDSISSFQSLRDGETLVSSRGQFELGFFSPGNSNSRYVGIWYKNIPVQTVVWVANRCHPINDSSGLLTINSTGNLVLLYQNNSAVWSTNSTKQATKSIVQLLDSGNLVLRDDENKSAPQAYLWQSFDFPSDTLLPGMKLGWDLRTGRERRLSAWRNSEDPCPGSLSCGFELEPEKQLEVFLQKGTARYYRSGVWNGVGFNGASDLTTQKFFSFSYVYNDAEIYYTYNLNIDTVLSRLVVNETASTAQQYIWLTETQTWDLLSSTPEDDCDKYRSCGAYATCVMNENTSECQCLRGFVVGSLEKWNLSEWPGGCVRKTPMSCDPNKVGFLKHSGLKLPDTIHSWVNESFNLQECKAICLSNCSCMAYSNLDVRREHGGCILWFGDLIDIKEFPSGVQDLYIRLPASELEKAGVKRRTLIIVAVLGCVCGVLLAGYCIYRRTSLKVVKEKDQDKEEKTDMELPLFDLATIASATDSFSTTKKLGEGGFGPVYKGTLLDGQEIAVKRLSNSSTQGFNEFKNEVILIAKLQHRNLVRLLGCCIQGEEKLLIYEYMPNKSLDFFIFDETRKKMLDWSQRFQIICGITRGLLYLHQDSRLRIIHRDLKAGNILLDSELNPKISDFGMAKTFGGNQMEGNTNRVVGTYDYMAPEYASDGLFSVKSDVFSFGILVLEVISGKKNRGFFHPDHCLNLAGHAWRLWKAGNASKLIDECLFGSCGISEFLRCIHISLLCVQQHPKDRPSMSSVVLMLGSQSSLDEPKHPGFFIENASLDQNVNASSNNQESFSTNRVTITMPEPR